MMNKAVVKICFINQSPGPLFKELVRAASSELGPTELIHSSRDEIEIPGCKSIRIGFLAKGSQLNRFVGWSIFFIILSLRAIISPIPPILFIVTNPPIMPFLGWLLSVIRGQRYILLFYDIYPEAIILFGDVPEKSIVVKSWRFLNRLSLSRADSVLTISPSMAKTLGQYYQMNEDANNLLILPTWVDTSWIQPKAASLNSFSLKFKQANELVILYAGHLGSVHDLSMLPQLASRLSKESKIRFFVVGDGPNKNDLMRECEKAHLSNITFLMPQKEELLPELLSFGDIGIVALAKGAERVSMPSKTYYIMSAGMALLGISNHDSDLSKIISVYKCGVNVEPGDLDSAVATIEGWYSDRESLSEMKCRARQAAIRNYDKSVIIPKILIRLFPKNE